MVEFAIVVPVVFFILLGMLDFSLIIAGNTAGANAAREGARVGIVHYDLADNATSANYTLIVNAVKQRLGGLVRGTGIVVAVRCVGGNDTTLPTKTCTSSGANPIVAGSDLIEVSLQWQHIGASPLVANAVHNEKAMLVIQGPATYSAAGATTTTTPPSTTTTIAPTTTTTAPATTTSTTTTIALTTTTTTTIPKKTPTVTGASPGSQAIGEINQPVVLTGTNFAPGAVAAFSNGVTVNSTTWNSATQLTVSISLTKATAGPATITVTNPDLGFGFNGGVFTVTARPTIVSLTPGSVPKKSTTKVVIAGTGFATGATVAFTPAGGVTVNATSVDSPTQITVTVDVGANDKGSYDVTVTNPDGGSFTTTGQPFQVT